MHHASASKHGYVSFRSTSTAREPSLQARPLCSRAVDYGHVDQSFRQDSDFRLKRSGHMPVLLKASVCIISIQTRLQTSHVVHLAPSSVVRTFVMASTHRHGTYLLVSLESSSPPGSSPRKFPATVAVAPCLVTTGSSDFRRRKTWKQRYILPARRMLIACPVFLIRCSHDQPQTPHRATRCGRCNSAACRRLRPYSLGLILDCGHERRTCLHR
jgi:uncharacterized paraquat-inducible protein A